MPARQRRFRPYRPSGLYRLGPPSPQQQQAAAPLRDQLIADHLRDKPTAAQKVILDLLIFAKAKHADAAHYLMSMPRPWCDKRSRSAWRIVHDTSKYVEVLPMFTSGRVRLLDHLRLVAQLLGLERRTSRAGRDSVDNQPNGHDDLANSAAGALVLAAQQATDDGPVLAANLAPERRGRLLDEREFELLGRGDY